MHFGENALVTAGFVYPALEKEHKVLLLDSELEGTARWFPVLLLFVILLLILLLFPPLVLSLLVPEILE